MRPKVKRSKIEAIPRGTINLFEPGCGRMSALEELFDSDKKVH